MRFSLPGADDLQAAKPIQKIFEKQYWQRLNLVSIKLEHSNSWQNPIFVMCPLISGSRWSEHLEVVGSLFMGIPMVFVKRAQCAKKTPSQFSLLLLPRKLWTNSANSGGHWVVWNEISCFSSAFQPRPEFSRGKHFAKMLMAWFAVHFTSSPGFFTPQPLVISFKKQIRSSPFRARRNLTLPAWRNHLSILFASPTLSGYLLYCPQTPQQARMILVKPPLQYYNPIFTSCRELLHTRESFPAHWGVIYFLRLLNM